MKPIVAHLPRFRPTHGWTNRILRIDLSNGTIRAQETMPYIPDFLAARGLANRIVWDEYPEPVDPFDPACPLMVFPGVLSGTHVALFRAHQHLHLCPTGLALPLVHALQHRRAFRRRAQARRL